MALLLIEKGARTLAYSTTRGKNGDYRTDTKTSMPEGTEVARSGLEVCRALHTF
jgi:hypothetical protein